MASKHILVVGAGVAGPMLAYWLARGGFRVTVVEKSSKMYKAGQGIDINGPAQKIVEKMPGVLDEIKKHTTGEEGFEVVDDNAEPIAGIPAGSGPTQEIEIMRGELVEVFTNAALSFETVDFRYGTTVEDIKQEDDGVVVTFGKKAEGEKAKFHSVIGADGMRSKTRGLALDPEQTKDCFKARDHYIAYFTIPRDPADGPNSRAQNDTGGRTIIVRPANNEYSSAYANVTAKSDKLEQAIEDDKQHQKEVLAETFADIGGMRERVIGQMMESEDFYFERLAQVKLKSWYNGRVTLIGDAAGAPSPITGEGTNVAIVTAYVLAGELTERPDNPEAAFGEYQRKLMPYVEKAQSIPLGGEAPKLINPQTKFGVWTLRTIFKLLADTRAYKIPSVDIFGVDEFELPSYPKLEGT